jgi:hypothetical protein
MYSWCAEYALEVPMSCENIWFLHQYSACSAASHRCYSLNTLIEEKKRAVECTCCFTTMTYHSRKKPSFFHFLVRIACLFPS